MRQERAKKLANAITVINWMFALGLTTLMIKCVVEWSMPEPKKEDKKQSIFLEEKPKSKEKKTLETYRACWEAEILESAIKVKEKKTESKKEEMKETPFELISVMVTEDNKSNYAVLKEKTSEKQILVKQGETVKGYKIELITKEHVKISTKGTKGIIEIKKDWLKLEKKEIK